MTLYDYNRETPSLPWLGIDGSMFLPGDESGCLGGLPIFNIHTVNHVLPLVDRSVRPKPKPKPCSSRSRRLRPGGDHGVAGRSPSLGH